MRKIIYLELDPVRFAKVLGRKGIKPVGFEQFQREDGRNMLAFTMLKADQTEAHRSIYTMPEILWAEYRDNQDGTIRYLITGQTKEFSLKSVVSALRKLKVPYSTDSTTRVRGFHNHSNGFSAMKNHDREDSISIHYRGNLPDAAMALKWDEVQKGLDNLGFATELDSEFGRLLVKGFK